MRFSFRVLLACSLIALSPVTCCPASFAQNYQAMAEYYRRMAAQQQAATRGVALYQQGMPRAMHPALAPQQQTYYGSSPGGAPNGNIAGMMDSMGLGLSRGDVPSGVTGMMQGMGLGLAPGAMATPGGITPFGGYVQPPYQGSDTGGPGPGNPGIDVPQQRGVGSSIPPGYVVEDEPPAREVVPPESSGAGAPPLPAPVGGPISGGAPSSAGPTTMPAPPAQPGLTPPSSGHTPARASNPASKSPTGPSAPKGKSDHSSRSWQEAFRTGAATQPNEDTSTKPQKQESSHSTASGSSPSTGGQSAKLQPAQSGAPANNSIAPWAQLFQKIPQAAFIPQLTEKWNNVGSKSKTRLLRP